MTLSPLRINFWSSPRNISTALMYSFAQRKDITVVDEPLYAAYLSRFPELDHPGRKEILASQAHSADVVIRETLLGDYSTEVVLFKQMTHHLEGIHRGFAKKMTNILLIRDPRAILASYSKVIHSPTLQGIGVALQLELKKYLEKAGALTAILDANELLKDPEGVLRQLCERLSLSFDPQMLYWPAGPRPEDGAWAPWWYSRVHQSTGFKPYEEKEISLPSHLETLAEECRPYYEELFNESIFA